MAAVVWGGLSAWGPAAGWVSERFGPVDVVHPGELSERLPGTVVVARRERLLAAPVSGTFEPLAAEGEALPAGAVVALVRPSGGGAPVGVRIPLPGVVSYYADGLEGSHSPEAVMGQDRPPERSAAPTPLVKEPQVASGQPVVRVVDHSALYAVFWPTAQAAGSAGVEVRPGAAVELSLPDESVGLRAVVLEVRGQPGRQRIWLAVGRQPADWLYRRRIDGAALIARRYRGTVVPASAITVRQGRPGVWARTGGGVAWLPVEVVGQVGDRVAVRGVPAGARIYRWPRWLGRR